jgi:hypothetical protein
MTDDILYPVFHKRIMCIIAEIIIKGEHRDESSGNISKPQERSDH